jgi:glycerophosphoryl diester phosphodiesterase
MGVTYIAPPIWVLVTSENGKMVPTTYAKQAIAAGLDIISWTAERSGSLKSGGGWYYQSIADLINNDGDDMNLLHTMHKDVGIKGMFSDWPATTTFYANCFGLN